MSMTNESVVNNKDLSASPTSSASSTSSVNNHQTRVNEIVKELLKEKLSLEKTGGQYANSRKLLALEIERLQNGGRLPSKEEKRPVDVIKEKPIRVTVKIIVPVRDHPKFNFVGKLLGPKGNSLKRLQEETMTKMAILGKGSMRDKKKEEELRTTCDPRYSHLHEDLHVEVTAFAPPAEAHARIAYALTQIRRFLIPDYNDDIRQEQMREMQLLNVSPGEAKVNGILQQGCRFTTDQSQIGKPGQPGVVFPSEFTADGVDELAGTGDMSDGDAENAVLLHGSTADSIIPWVHAQVNGARMLPQQAVIQTQPQQHPALRGLSGKQLEGVLLNPGDRSSGVGAAMGSILTRLQAAGGIQNLHCPSTPFFPSAAAASPVISLLSKARIQHFPRNGFQTYAADISNDTIIEHAAGYHLSGYAGFCDGYGNLPIFPQLANPIAAAGPPCPTAEWADASKAVAGFRNLKSADRARYRAEPYPRTPVKNLPTATTPTN